MRGCAPIAPEDKSDRLTTGLPDAAQADAPLDQIFAQALARAASLPPRPRLAVAVSGGADSMALALLADDWVRPRGGAILALIIDHGLRESSAEEASLTAARLAARDIPARIIRLSDLAHGPALSERARVARYAALSHAARAAGLGHVLLGHHAGDQAETIAMRAARGPSGLQGMARMVARDDVLLIRPLLDVAPASLRAFLTARQVDWVEDPSNQDWRYERARLRHGEGLTRPATAQESEAKAASDRETARWLAAHVTLRPEGFARFAADAVPAGALSALVRVIGGAVYPPPRAQIARLVRQLAPASLAGVCIIRERAGWVLCREPGACAPPVAAMAGALWDGRFRVRAAPAAGGAMGAQIGALGARAADFRRISPLRAQILRGLPAIWVDGAVIAVPHLGIGDPAWRLSFAPPTPLAAHHFVT